MIYQDNANRGLKNIIETMNTKEELLLSTIAEIVDWWMANIEYLGKEIHHYRLLCIDEDNQTYAIYDKHKNIFYGHRFKGKPDGYCYPYGSFFEQVKILDEFPHYLKSYINSLFAKDEDIFYRLYEDYKRIKDERKQNF